MATIIAKFFRGKHNSQQHQPPHQQQRRNSTPSHLAQLTSNSSPCCRCSANDPSEPCIIHYNSFKTATTTCSLPFYDNQPDLFSIEVQQQIEENNNKLNICDQVEMNKRSCPTNNFNITLSSAKDIDNIQKKRRTEIDYNNVAIVTSLPSSIWLNELPLQTLEKMHAFQVMCDKHIEFLISSRVVDKYLLSMVLIYFERSRMKLVGYSKDRYFFYALYLAMEMEEDTLDGLTEIIHYILGPAPCTLFYGEARKEEQTRAQALWDQRLTQFYQGKDALWARMSYNAYVPYEDTCAVSARFPMHQVLSRTRTPKDLSEFSCY